MKMVETQRIVSFLPSATEMICALGLGDRLLGVTHECDYPPEITGKPVVVRNVLPIESMSQSEIDSAVTQRLRNGLSLYRVDEALMQEIAPDLILTQDLCQVCAPSGNEVSELLKVLPSKPQILWLTPKSLEQIFDNLRDLGEATGRLQRAETLIAEGRVYAVDANSYFARPGPRVVAGTELLAHLLHPDLFEWKGPGGAFRSLESVCAR
jgi:iron complex transport system substrate-binding protein